MLFLQITIFAHADITDCEGVTGRLAAGVISNFFLSAAISAYMVMLVFVIIVPVADGMCIGINRRVYYHRVACAAEATSCTVCRSC